MQKRRLEVLGVELDRDSFLRRILRELSGTLQSVVGLEQARGFVSLVGQQIGESINLDYRQALGVAALSRDDVAEALVDLKARIQGDFSIESIDERRIVLTNTRCPFGEHVSDRPSLCMMTSNVFGTITAENLGYARVRLEETIAEGNGGCRVVVELQSNGESSVATDNEREYFAGS